MDIQKLSTLPSQVSVKNNLQEQNKEVTSIGNIDNKTVVQENPSKTGKSFSQVPSNKREGSFTETGKSQNLSNDNIQEVVELHKQEENISLPEGLEDLYFAPESAIASRTVQGASMLISSIHNNFLALADTAPEEKDRKQIVGLLPRLKAAEEMANTAANTASFIKKKQVKDACPNESIADDQERIETAKNNQLRIEKTLQGIKDRSYYSLQEIESLLKRASLEKQNPQKDQQKIEGRLKTFVGNVEGLASTCQKEAYSLSAKDATMRYEVIPSSDLNKSFSGERVRHFKSKADTLPLYDFKTQKSSPPSAVPQVPKDPNSLQQWIDLFSSHADEAISVVGSAIKTTGNLIPENITHPIQSAAQKVKSKIEEHGERQANESWWF